MDISARTLRVLWWSVLVQCCWTAGGQPPDKAGGVPLAARDRREFQDEWPAIANATNAWAVQIRQRRDWEEVSNASLDQLRRLAEQGSPLAQLRLAYCCFTGTAVRADPVGAVKWLLSPAQEGLAPAQFMLGYAQWNGLGTPRNEPVAVEWFTKAAEQDFADAQFMLGLAYLNGGSAPDRRRGDDPESTRSVRVFNRAPARGAKWLLKAAHQGKPHAQLTVGQCYDEGNGVTRDPAQAATWFRAAGDSFRRSAEQGDAQAEDVLAINFARGLDLVGDPNEGLKWCRKAAERGNGIAQIKLAVSYARGDGVSKDEAEAAGWWRKAAEKGLASAQFYFGLCCYEGSGVSKDDAAAVSWWRTAVERYHLPSAELFLALCYWKGEGVTKDPAQADALWRHAAMEAGIGNFDFHDGSPNDTASGEKWWRQVAEQGSPRLQYWLAQFYQLGKGVTRDLAEALKWYRKAADSGEIVALNAAAWIMATSEHSEIRNGAVAVDYAEKAAAATGRKEAGILETLAAALAEAGEFEKAVKVQKEAIALARHIDARKQAESRLKLYQGKAPYRAQDDLVDFSRR
jgi:TPR repeat protein